MFIAGCQRSGTTALLHLLNEDERCVLGRERFKKCAAAITPASFREDHFFSPHESETNYRAQEYYKKLRARWRSGSARYIGDKVPFYYKHLFHLAESFRGARFLFLIRDLHGVASSYNARAANPEDTVWKPSTTRSLRLLSRYSPRLRHRLWAEVDYRQAAVDWNESLTRLLEFVEAGYRRQVFVVHYESFFSGQEAYLGALYEFLELPLSPALLEHYRRATRGWPERVARPPNLTQEMREHLESQRNRGLEARCLALAPHSPRATRRSAAPSWR